MIKVSSTEFDREPNRYQGIALAEPVVVTRNGRDTVVVISVEEFQRLKRNDRTALGIEDFTPGEIEAVRAAQPSQEAEGFNYEVDAMR